MNIEHPTPNIEQPMSNRAVRVDSGNAFLVGGSVDGGAVVINGLFGRPAMSPEEAAVLAAWLVAVGGREDVLWSALEEIIK